MDNNYQNDELRVEPYDAKAAADKKKRILKKVGLFAAGVVLGIFGFVAVFGSLFVTRMGGSGSWYESVVLPLEDSDE